VARHAVNTGAKIVNDISSGEDDDNMLAFIASAGISYVAMHKQGKPKTMQHNPIYKDVVAEVIDYFKEKDILYTQMGIKDWILDPGFGFGKTIAHNFLLLRNLNELKKINKPILVGISRKSMIWKTLGSQADNALNGTTALHMVALIKGADILRVHDVKEAAECVTLYESLYAN
jgi:dihydropteroate synthase